MPSSFSFGNVRFDVGFGERPARPPREPDAPFVMLVVGDFSGRASRGVQEPLGSRRAQRVDCDNFETVFQQMEPAVQLPAADGGSGPLKLRFESLDDFHPDHLLKNVPALAELMEVRRRLMNPSTAAAAVPELQRLLGALPPVGSTSIASSAASPACNESTQETMARLLGGTPPGAPASNPTRPAAGTVDINALIKGLVAPSVVPNASPEQTAALGAVEIALAVRLRNLLHAPLFQELEAAWRGLDMLVRAHGGEDEIKIHLLDLSKAELAVDLRAQENLALCGLGSLLREKSWSAVLCTFSFAGTVDEIETLGRLARVVAMPGAALLAGASPVFFGCDCVSAHADPLTWTQPLSAESAAAWTALRGLPEAAHVGLIAPRVLLRQPYGKGSDPIESFPFEELPAELAHESFLWGSGAFVVGHLLAEAFRAEGWEFPAGGAGELDDLPVFKFVEAGETRIKPCAEAWLSENAGEKILAAGLMPLLSIRGRGAVRLMSLRSIAPSGGPLSIRRP